MCQKTTFFINTSLFWSVFYLSEGLFYLALGYIKHSVSLIGDEHLKRIN